MAASSASTISRTSASNPFCGFQPKTRRIFFRRTDQFGRVGRALERCVMPYVFFRGKIDDRERRLDEVLDGMGFARGDDIIVGLGVLKHQPHRLHVILRVAPIAPRGHIPEHQLVLESAADPRHRARDFARDEVLAAPRRLVIVENPVADKEPVSLPVNARQLGRKSLGATVGAGRAKRCLLGLGRFDRVAKNLRARGVIKTQGLRLIARNLEQAQSGHCDFFRSRFRDFETQANMALTGQVINLRRLHLGKNAAERGAIGQIAVMEKELAAVD